MTVLLVTLLFLSTGVLSALFCGLYLHIAHRRKILDSPNERSSHAVPTPHGGGVPLLLAFYAGLLLAAALGAPWSSGLMLIALVSVLLMALGVVDDLRGLAVRTRMAAYGILCLASALLLLADTALPQTPGPAGLLLVCAIAFALLWFLNLYNFMDGIDGIAGLQAVLALAAASLLLLLSGGDETIALFCLLLAAAHTGFLVFNWPPARLFMGDAGSVPTGFLLAGLALVTALADQLSVYCWLILMACFIADASCTLLWRILTGQPFTEAHRLHAYQRLARRWQSHRAVDLLLLCIFLFWLLPLSVAAAVWPQIALILVIVTYLPLLFGMAKIAALK